MKINTIRLNNIGPYNGNNVFELGSSNTNTNITLIGGKNGTGKTTLLKAIKIGLFGCFSYGYKTINSTYLKEIKNMLHNKADENSKYFIEISFSLVENYKTQSYTLHREWIINNGEIKEIVCAYFDNKLLNEYDTLELENRLKSVTSPALINSFIYDGEKIGSIIEHGDLEEYIKNVFYSIFNIDLIDQLSQDLESYMIDNRKSSYKNIQYDVANLLNNINFIKNEIKTNENYLTNIKKDLENIKIEIESKRKEYKTLGGMTKEEIQIVINKVNEIEKKKEKDSLFMKNFNDEYLSFAMLISELKTVSKKAKKELPLKYAKQLKAIQKILKIDMSEYIKILEKKGKVEVFGLEEEEICGIDNFIKEIETKKQTAIQILGDKELSDDLSDLREKLDKNNSINKLIEISNEINLLQTKLNSKNEEYNEISLKLKEIYQEKENLIKRYDNAIENIKKDKLMDSSYIQCTNSLKLCEILKNKLIENKLDAVAKKTCEIFNKTIRKKDFISRMQFENGFCFRLYDVNGNELPSQLLSAGEMQILVSSLIWAMYKVSGRNEMFIFDTPLARLDTENRIRFIKNIIATISKQVIILSTDSEFVGENLESIQENINYKYLLVYNDNTGSTNIENEYFGGNV